MIPRSSRSCRLSRRSCASSACSLLVSPGRLPRSISACVTQRRTAVSVRSRSRATSGIDRFPFRHSSTTSALKAGVNALLRRRCCIACSIGEHPPGAATPHFGCPPNRGKPTRTLMYVLWRRKLLVCVVSCCDGPHRTVGLHGWSCSFRVLRFLPARRQNAGLRRLLPQYHRRECDPGDDEAGTDREHEAVAAGQCRGKVLATGQQASRA